MYIHSSPAQRKNILHFHNASVHNQRSQTVSQAHLRSSGPSWINFDIIFNAKYHSVSSLRPHKSKPLLLFFKGYPSLFAMGKPFITVSISLWILFRASENLSTKSTWLALHWAFVPISSSSTDRCSPGINLKMCLRTLALLLLRGRVPNKEETLVSSQEGERELLLPAKLELLERPRDWWWWLLLLDENLPELSCERQSLEKKQPSSKVLAALKGLGELRSPNTLAWSLSSVITLL